MKKKNSRFFWWVLIIFFIVYIGYYIGLESGYYETKLRDKTYLTSEGIKEFEKDVASGKELDVTKYITDEKIDSSNSMSNLGNKISISVETFMTKGIFKTIKILGKLFSG